MNCEIEVESGPICQYCGAKLVESPPQTACTGGDRAAGAEHGAAVDESAGEATAVCPECGQPLVPGMVFCPCGQTITASGGTGAADADRSHGHGHGQQTGLVPVLEFEGRACACWPNATLGRRGDIGGEWFADRLTVSGYHCQFVCEGGAWFVVRLPKSKNTVYVDDMPLAENQRQRLTGAHRLNLGRNVALRVHLGEAAT